MRQAPPTEFAPAGSATALRRGMWLPLPPPWQRCRLERIVADSPRRTLWAVRGQGGQAWVMTVRPWSAATWSAIRREVSLQQRARGHHCLPALAAFVAHNRACALFARARGPSLAAQLDQRQAQPNSVDPHELVALAAALAAAVACTHRAGVLHRDIKPDNYLYALPSARPQSLWLSDFEFCCRAARPAVDGAGTLAYQAPEVLAGAAHTLAADAFSLGATLAELACGMTPFEGDDEYATADNLRSGDAVLGVDDVVAMLVHRDVPLQTAVQFARLCFALCAPRPSDRITAADAFVILAGR